MKILSTISIYFIFLSTTLLQAQLMKVKTDNLKPSSPLIGIDNNGSIIHNSTIYKGQKKYLGNYGARPSSGEDTNDDGVFEIMNESIVSNNNLHWFSFDANYQIESQLFPYQGFNRMANHYVDATNLSVGATYNFYSRVCSETAGGMVGARACVAISACYVTVIPYYISLTSIQSSNGSSANYQINWNAPSPLYCTIDHYELYRRDTDTIKISELNFATRLSGNILSTQRTISVTNDQRSKNSYYVLVCYDKYGEAIGISKNHQITFPTNTFSLSSPADGSVVTSLAPTLDWQDYGTGNTYKLTYSSNSDFSNPLIVTGITQSEYSFSSPLADNSTYYWKVEVEGSGVISNQTGWNFNVNVCNNSPNNFALTTPSNSSSTNTLRPYLSWDVSNDVGDVVNYNILIATDNSFTNVVVDDIVQTNYYWVNSNLVDDTQYYWKVIATDSQSQSTWSNIYSFSTNYDNYPSGFELISPDYVYNSRPNETGLTPTFSWNSSTDNDPGSTITYTLWYSQDSSFTTKTQITSLTTNTYTVVTPLEEDNQYFWKVFAVDNNGNQTQNYGKAYSFVTNSVNSNPTTFNPISPINSTVSPIVTFYWGSSTDQDFYDQKIYVLEIATDASMNNIVSTSKTSSTSATISISTGGTYYWRVTENSINATLCSECNGGSYVTNVNGFYVDASTITLNFEENNWIIGSYQIIRTHANYYLGASKLEVSYDNQQTWTLLQNLNGSDCIYRWLIPNVPSEHCYIKVTDTVNGIVTISTNFQIKNAVITNTDPSLVLYLPFDGDFADYSGRNYTISNYGPSQNPSVLESSVTLTNDRLVNSKNAAKFVTGSNFGEDAVKTLVVESFPENFSNGFTFSTWLKINTSSMNYNPIATIRFSNDKYLIIYSVTYASPSEKYVLSISDPTPDPSVSERVNFPSSFPRNEWHHLATTLNSAGTVKLFFDGALVNQGVISSQLSTAQRLDIGNVPWSSGFSNLLQGEIDDYRLYNRALSDSEINSLYQLTPLPVELALFDVNKVGDNVIIKWNTATEVNNYGFEILRSVLDDKWEKIGFVQGYGNSNSEKAYSYIDGNPPSGKVKYRLKQIDFDGKYDYSKIVEILVDLPAVYKLTQNYPNPFNPTTTIEYGLPKSSLVIIKVYDVLGNEVATLVNQEKPAGNFEVKFDGSKFTSGIYFYQIKAGSFIETKKFILMK